MIAHLLQVGQTIFDIYSNRWGEIKTIGGETEEVYTSDENLVIGYTFENSKGETSDAYGLAKDIYPLAVDRTFKGEDVCWEINVDVFNEEHNYDYFCPNLNENCWEFEVESIW